MNADYLSVQAQFLKTAEPLIDKFGDRIDIVGDEVKKHPNPFLSFSDYDKATLAVMLDNVDKALLRYKHMKGIGDRTYSETVGPFKKHAYNIISALYTTLDIRDLVSLQPLTQKIGALYYLTYKYASNKGNIDADDVMFSPKEPGKRNGYYSTQWVKQEALTFTFDSTDSSAGLEYYPVVDPSDISLVITGGAAAGTWTYLATSGGVFQLQKDDSGTNDGSINPTTGVITLDSVDASGASSAVIDYRWNSEKFSDSVPNPKVTIGVTEKLVEAERRQLMVETMLDVSYDFESQFARSLSAEMENTVIQFMQNEQSFRVLGEMFDGADGNQGNTYQFDKTPTSGISKIDHAHTLFELLGQMSTQIRNNIGAGWGNRIVVGDDLLNYLRILPTDMFRRVPKPRGNGPYYAGMLNDEYGVYYNPELPAAEFFMAYKGDNWWEAPYYVGSYLPLMASQFMMFPDFHAEQGYISMEAYEYEFPKLVVKGSVTAS